MRESTSGGVRPDHVRISIPSPRGGGGHRRDLSSPGLLWSPSSSSPAHGVFQRNKHQQQSSPWSVTADLETRERWEDHLEYIATRIGSNEEGALLDELSREDLDVTLVDLRPFMHRSPHVLSADASMLRAYTVMRGLGLRYLFTTSNRPEVSGLITRKDVTHEHAALVLAQQAKEDGLIKEQIHQNKSNGTTTGQMRRRQKKNKGEEEATSSSSELKGALEKNSPYEEKIIQ